VIDLRSLQRALGGEISGGQLLCPGPGHSPRDRSLSVRPIGDDFVVFSHSGDGWTQCKDFVRQRLGLPAWQPGDGHDRHIDRLRLKTFERAGGCHWPWLAPQTALIDFNPMPPQIAESSVLSYGCSTSARRITLMPTNRWQPGVSGNPAGRLRGSRNKLSEEVICALLRDFRQHGQKAVARVRRTQPAAYLKILALLVPREHKVEHSNALKNLTDEQLEAMIEYIKSSLEAQAGGRAIEGTIETVEPTALPALEPPRPKNRLMLEADTAVGPSDHKRSRKVPSPSGA
jgi:hypothetical protein